MVKATLETVHGKSEKRTYPYIGINKYKMVSNDEYVDLIVNSYNPQG